MDTKLALALGLTVMAGAARVAWAEREVSVAIAYDAPTTCPGAPAFAEALRARNPRIRVVDRAGARTLHVAIEANGSRFIGRMTTHDRKGGDAERTVAGDTCAEVVDGLAFVASLAIEASAAEPAVDASAEPASRPLDPGAASSPSSSSPSTPPPAHDDREPIDDRAALDAKRRQHAWGVAVGVDAELLSGPAPTVLFTAPVFVDVSSTSRSPFAPGARVSLQRATATTHAEGPAAQITLTAAALDLCPLAWTAERLRLVPCARAEVGLLGVTGTGIEPARDSSRPWLTAGAAGRAMVTLADPLFLELDGSLSAVVVRDRYFFEPNQTVLRLPPTEWTLALGVGARIW